MATSTEQRKIEIIANGSKVNSSFKEMAASASLINNQLKKMTPGTKEFVDKSQQLQTVRQRMGEVKDQMYGTQKAQAALTDQFGQYIPFYGQLQKIRAGYMGVNAAVGANVTGLKLLRVALVSTGIGAIVVILGSLIAYLSTTQEGMDKITAVTRPLATIFQRLLGVLQELGGKVFKTLGEAISNPKQALIDLGNIIKENVLNRFEAFGKFIPAFSKLLDGDLRGGLTDLGNATIQMYTGIEDGLGKIGDAAKQTKDFINESIDAGTRIDQLNKDIERQDIANTVRRAELTVAYAENKEIAQDLSKTEKERIAAAQKAGQAQNDLLQMEQDFLNMKIELKAEEQALNDTDRTGEKEYQDLLKEKILFEAAASKKRASAKSLENTALREAAAEAKKYAMEQQKAEEAYLKAVSDTTYAIEELRIAAMEEGIDKTLAGLGLKHRKELEQMEAQRQEILEMDRITEAQRQELLAQFDEQRRLRDEAAQQEVVEAKKAQLEKDEEEREKEKERQETERQERIDNELDQFEEDLERELLKEEIRQEEKNIQQEELFVAVLDRERAQEEARLDLQREYAQKKLNVLIAAGQGESIEALNLKKQILKIEKEKAETSMDYEKRKTEFKQKMDALSVQSATDTLSSLLSLLDKNTAAYKAAAVALKAIKVAEVISSGIKEIQSIWEQAASLPPGAAQIYGAINTAAAIGRSLVAIRDIKATALAEGGASLDPTRQIGLGKILEMQLRNGTYSYEGRSLAKQGSYASGGMISQPSIGIVGERGSEWVGPNWMLTSPKYANIFKYLESERIRKVSAFASGGATGNIPGSGEDMEQIINEFSGLKAAFISFAVEIAAWQRDLRVINDPTETDAALRVRNEIDRESTLTR